MFRLFVLLCALFICSVFAAGIPEFQRTVVASVKIVNSGESDDAFEMILAEYLTSGYPLDLAVEVTDYVLLRAVGHDVSMPAIENVEWPDGVDILSPRSSAKAILLYLLTENGLSAEDATIAADSMLHAVSVATGGSAYLEDPGLEPGTGKSPPKCGAYRVRAWYCENNESMVGHFLLSRAMIDLFRHQCVEAIPLRAIGETNWMRVTAREGCTVFPHGPADLRVGAHLTVTTVECDDPDFVSYPCFDEIEPGEADCEAIDYRCCATFAGCDDLICD